MCLNINLAERRGAVEARRAHNPDVLGSKPSGANLFFLPKFFFNKLIKLTLVTVARNDSIPAVNVANTTETEICPSGGSSSFLALFT